MMGARMATPVTARRTGYAALAGAVALGAALAGGGSAMRAQVARPIVYVVPIEGVIDLGLAPYLQRVLDEASAAHAAAVILRVNTLGGRVDAAILMRDALLRAPVRTVAFINTRAISAGALVSLATHTIAMAEGGTFGAATPVTVGAPGGAAQPVEEKTVSYMRTEFRATAEARKRSPQIAEAMVDADIEVAGLSDKGKLLTLTTEEALTHKIIDFRAATLEEVLARLDLAQADVRELPQTWAETLVRLLTHPTLSALLLALGILGLIIEIQTPGFGVPGGLGLVCLGLFFGGHWLVELAGWEELLLVASGLALLAVEVFVTPGFGVVGLLGIGALLGGLSLSVVGAGATWDVLLFAGGRVAAALVLALVLAAGVLGTLPRLPVSKRLILDRELTAGTGFASAPPSDQRWLGKRGEAVSDLRPAGIAAFEQERVDVVSDGTFIDAGAPVEVTRVDGNRIVVRRATDDHTGGTHGS